MGTRRTGVLRQSSKAILVWVRVVFNCIFERLVPQFGPIGVSLVGPKNPETNKTTQKPALGFTAETPHDGSAKTCNSCRNFQLKEKTHPPRLFLFLTCFDRKLVSVTLTWNMLLWVNLVYLSSFDQKTPVAQRHSCCGCRARAHKSECVMLSREDVGHWTETFLKAIPE